MRTVDVCAFIPVVKRSGLCGALCRYDALPFDFPLHDIISAADPEAAFKSHAGYSA